MKNTLLQFIEKTLSTFAVIILLIAMATWLFGSIIMVGYGFAGYWWLSVIGLLLFSGWLAFIDLDIWNNS